MLGQLVAGSGEHALVLRDDRTREFRGADVVHAIPQDERFGWAVGLDSEIGFLVLGVGLRLGQNRRRGLCANHRFAAADHLER